MTGLQIEPLRREHLDRVVSLHRKCFGAHDSVERLGRRFTRRTLQFFADDALSFGFVALHGERVIGFVVGRSDEWLDALNHYRRRAALIGLLTRPWLVLQLEIPTRLTRLLAKKLRGRNGAPRTDGRDEILGEGLSIDRLGVLAILAADSDFHQLRPAEHLLKAAHGFCRTHGLSAVRASVHRENLQSRFLYRRLGYVDREASDASKFVLYYLALT